MSLSSSLKPNSWANEVDVRLQIGRDVVPAQHHCISVPIIYVAGRIVLLVTADSSVFHI